MKKICNIIIILLIIIAVILFIWIFNRYMRNCQNEQNKQNAVTQKQEQLGTSEEQPDIEYEGYQVIVIIKIEKIGLEYPILSVTTEESMKRSITKFWGDQLNQAGNVALAGHNNFDGTMFRKNKQIRNRRQNCNNRFIQSYSNL